jgi:L-ascorbate metabolism protein UlaG (beta-lactamase superfamily)
MTVRDRLAPLALALALLLARPAPAQNDTMCGIGAGLRLEDGAVVITAVYQGTPAEKAGLTRGARILAVDGEPARDLRFNDLLARIRGREGTDVTLKVRLPDGTERDVTITRARFAVPIEAPTIPDGLPEELRQDRQWLRNNPFDARNNEQRLAHTRALQTACDLLSNRQYVQYLLACRKGDADRAAAFEARQPALAYLRAATEQALCEVHETRLERGVVLWHFYNMGYVVKTPTACFGFDINFPGAERLAPHLDFLLISHRHHDHLWPPLLEAMLEARKPVVTQWLPGSRIVTRPADLRFGDVRVRVDVGDHGFWNPATRDDMLMFRADCGPRARHCVIYHTGDGTNVKKIRGNGPVDVLILHVSSGLPIPAAVKKLRPRYTLVSHVMELAHSPVPPQAWRFPWQRGFKTAEALKGTRATVLTWGERWIPPAADNATGADD